MQLCFNLPVLLNKMQLLLRSQTIRESQNVFVPLNNQVSQHLGFIIQAIAVKQDEKNVQFMTLLLFSSAILNIKLYIGFMVNQFVYANVYISKKNCGAAYDLTKKGKKIVFASQTMRVVHNYYKQTLDKYDEFIGNNISELTKLSYPIQTALQFKEYMQVIKQARKGFEQKAQQMGQKQIITKFVESNQFYKGLKLQISCRFNTQYQFSYITLTGKDLIMKFISLFTGVIVVLFPLTHQYLKTTKVGYTLQFNEQSTLYKQLLNEKEVEKVPQTKKYDEYKQAMLRLESIVNQKIRAVQDQLIKKTGYSIKQIYANQVALKGLSTQTNANKNSLIEMQKKYRVNQLETDKLISKSRVFQLQISRLQRKEKDATQNNKKMQTQITKKIQDSIKQGKQNPAKLQRKVQQLQTKIQAVVKQAQKNNQVQLVTNEQINTDIQSQYYIFQLQSKGFNDQLNEITTKLNTDSQKTSDIQKKLNVSVNDTEQGFNKINQIINQIKIRSNEFNFKINEFQQKEIKSKNMANQVTQLTKIVQTLNQYNKQQIKRFADQLDQTKLEFKAIKLNSSEIQKNNNVMRSKQREIIKQMTDFQQKTTKQYTQDLYNFKTEFKTKINQQQTKISNKIREHQKKEIENVRTQFAKFQLENIQKQQESMLNMEKNIRDNVNPRQTEIYQNVMQLKNKIDQIAKFENRIRSFVIDKYEQNQQTIDEMRNLIMSIQSQSLKSKRQTNYRVKNINDKLKTGGKAFTKLNKKIQKSMLQNFKNYEQIRELQDEQRRTRFLNTLDTDVQKRLQIMQNSTLTLKIRQLRDKVKMNDHQYQSAINDLIQSSY